jgi:K+-sensing histidine kinase KdpD
MKILEMWLEKAKKSDYAKDIFIAAMSHEFRSPLNSLLCSLEVLTQSGLDALSKNQKDLISTAANWGEILLSLINNVLDVTKLQTNKLDLAL